MTAVNPRSPGREHQVRTCLSETLKVLQQMPPVPTHPLALLRVLRANQMCQAVRATGRSLEPASSRD